MKTKKIKSNSKKFDPFLLSEKDHDRFSEIAVQFGYTIEEIYQMEEIRLGLDSMIKQVDEVQKLIGNDILKLVEDCEIYFPRRAL